MLYDDLGVAPDASPDELRKAYRGLARQLHPDLHPDLSDQAGSDEQMRRLNRAWAVLGNPAAREEYDRTLRAPAPTSRHLPDPAGRPAQHQGPAPGQVDAGPLPPWRWLRPSVIAVAVLVIIFIATAYAGPHHNSGPGPTPVSSTVAGGPGPAPVATPAPSASGSGDQSLVGKCLLALPGYDAVVGCSSHNDGLVVGQTARSADCGAGTTVHQLAGRSQFVCLVRPTP